MKKKINPIFIIIVILIVVLITIIYMYVSPTSTNTTNTEISSDILEAEATIQSIENSLSSSGQISSALDEKIKLHASYYFEELLVEENVYLKEGTNIIEYTNGTYLTAPYDCVLISSDLPNAEEICTTSHYIEIQSIETLCMSLSINETDINKVEIGDVVDITITATQEVLEGRITSISEVGTYSSSGSYFNSVVTFENNGNLKIGMSASCEIIIEKAENVVTVPLEAIQTSDEGKYVIVIDDSGETSNVNVETGISNDAYIEIKSGITEGTKVQMTESSASNSNNGFGNFGGNRQNSRENGREMMEIPSSGMQGGERPSMP